MARFFVRADAVAAGRVRFDADETRHLVRVRRLRPGAMVEAADGTGRLFSVRLDALDADGAWGTVLGEAAGSAESPCAITLAQALLKGDRMTWIVQKATELGVARIVPLRTARVVARPPGDRARSREARWQRVAREAVKQCGRAVVPVVAPPLPFASALAEIAQHDVAWLLWQRSGVPAAAAGRAVGRPRRLLLLVGPEGGFTDEEAARAEAAGARLVGLGPRILRADAAGLVGLVLCQHLFGDLGAEPDGGPR